MEQIEIQHFPTIKKLVVVEHARRHGSPADKLIILVRASVDMMEMSEISLTSKRCHN